MLITLLNIAAVILIIVGVCVLLGLMAVGGATGFGLLIAGIICAVVSYVLSHGSRVI